MSDGTEFEETQPQSRESRESSGEVQETAARRDQEVVTQPEAVIERERPVQESEAIHTELVEVMAAVASAGTSPAQDFMAQEAQAAQESTPADTEEGRAEGKETLETTQQRTAERESPPDIADEISVIPINLPDEAPEAVQASIEQASVIPINLPDEAPEGRPESRAEVSASPGTAAKPEAEIGAEEFSTLPLPIPDPDSALDGGEATDLPGPLPAGRDGSQTGSRESAEVLDETSFKVESQAGLEDAILDGTSFKVESQAEIEDAVLDDASFKFYTPRVEAELQDDSLDQGVILPGSLEDTASILDGDAFKPVPAIETVQAASQEGRWSEALPGLGMESASPTESFRAALQESQGGESGSVLIDGEAPEGQETDLSGEEGDSDQARDAGESGPDWYVHETSDGKKVVVDGDGNPVPSPPILYEYNGKTYAIYPGDEGAIGEDGTIKDPSKLTELPAYEKSVEGMYIHDDGQGNYTVVDEKGNPVASPPMIVTYEGKQYLVYPGQDLGVDDKDYVKDPAALKAHETSFYQGSTEGMYIHDDGKGNYTVVDEQGNPVECPPIIVTYQGKQYLVYPGQDLGVDDKDYVKDPAALQSHEASIYQGSTDGMYIHDDGQGNYTVVDENGNPVTSPPIIVTYEGKQYLVYPGQDLGIGEDGTVKDPAALKAHEASYYVPPWWEKKGIAEDE